MKTLVDQYLSKGPRAQYQVAVTERDDGLFEVLYRWENPKSSDARTFTYRDAERARQRAREKVDELVARGYERRPNPRPAPRPPAEVTRGLAELEQLAKTTGSPSTDADSLDDLLARRRREASWSLG